MQLMMWNGIVCTSGFAYMTAANTGACANFTSVQYNALTVTAPYSCDASTGLPCTYIFNPLVAGISSTCQCPLDGTTNGYCQYPGPSEFYNYGQALRYIASKSAKCHTTDRYNIAVHPECTIA